MHFKLFHTNKILNDKLCRKYFYGTETLNVSSVAMKTGCFLLNAAVGCQRSLVVKGDGCRVGGLVGDLVKYAMNGAVFLLLCRSHLAIFHSNRKDLSGLHGVCVDVSE